MYTLITLKTIKHDGLSLVWTISHKETLVKAVIVLSLSLLFILRVGGSFVAASNKGKIIFLLREAALVSFAIFIMHTATGTAL